MSSLRYLWLHTNYDAPMMAWHEQLLHRRRERGFDIEMMVLKPDPSTTNVYYFPELDRLWKRGDPKLMRMYEILAEKLQGKDVLIHFNGANLHPEFLQQLSVFKVYHCSDDPESTDILSKPVAPYYDLHLIGNIAELDTYRSWGLAHVYFLPNGSQVMEEELSDLNMERILDLQTRNIPIVFFGAFGGVFNRRAKRLSTLAKAFPQAYCAGSGWPRGFISQDEMWKKYRHAQLGWNIHNSTGPINFRVYDLPAFGVMQICDNKSHLGQVFELGKEVVGFETVDECIDLTQYYLTHPEEQRAIAAAGWQRWKEDYTPDRVWDRLVSMVEKHYDLRPAFADVSLVQMQLNERQEKTRLRRIMEEISEIPYNLLIPIARRIRKQIMTLLRQARYLQKH
jgi:spore maturation protein CgeB